ncbi:MAG: serine/threonine protein kinase, partial [Rhizobacter sp.]
MSVPTSSESTPAGSGAPAAFGRFELRRLLAKSAGTMVWLAHDPRRTTELLVVMPCEPVAGVQRLEAWLQRIRHLARLDHPNLARVVDVGVYEHWPFAAFERGKSLTVPEWLAGHCQPLPAEAVGWIRDALQGLAYAHEAGIVHGDVQLDHLLVGPRGRVALLGLGVTRPLDRRAEETSGTFHGRGMAVDPSELRAQRAAAARDVLACGVLLQHLLSGHPPLGLADTAHVIERMAPATAQVVYLPSTTPLPVPDALRAIVDRATSGQVQARYRSARTLVGALDGWLRVKAHDVGGPIELLLERVRSVGHLPAVPGLAARVSRVAAVEGQRTDEIARAILPDLALSLELLRAMNTMESQSARVPGDGPVLALRRAIALVGIDGVRTAAASLRPWPGALSPEDSQRLRKTMNRVRLAAHLAEALRPAGYDPEVVYLIAVLQNLGRLLVRYHFSAEAGQMDLLIAPAPTAEAAGVVGSTMSEASAALAVFGVELEAFGIAVARHWGFEEDVLHMVRRVPADQAPRKAANDAEVLRALASAANDVVD